MMTLYYSPGAVSFASHVVLNEMNVPFATKRVTLAKGEHLLPDYLAVNYRARVPALVVDGKVITESAGILTWLGQQCELFPPSGSIEAAVAGEWLAWIASVIHISFAQVWRASRYADDMSMHDAIRIKGLLALESQFAEVETRLSQSGFALEFGYSVVDPNLMVFYRFGNRVGFDMRGRYPRWTANVERLLGRNAVAKTVAEEGIEIWLDPDDWTADVWTKIEAERGTNS
ncbi:MAG: glutathione S-transferase family protein [Sphingorhabdus sp.]